MIRLELTEEQAETLLAALEMAATSHATDALDGSWDALLQQRACEGLAELIEGALDGDEVALHSGRPEPADKDGAL